MKTKKLSTRSYYKITPENFHVNGLLYYYENNNFYRLPVTQKYDEGLTRLTKFPAGAYLDFTTNSSSIGVNVTLRDKSYMPHMTATGTIGLDLYEKLMTSMFSWEQQNLMKLNLHMSILKVFQKYIKN